MATSLEIIRIVATEFSAVDKDTIQTWIDLTAPLVSRKRFGKVYEQALALLTAHRMKIAEVGSDKSTSDSELDELGGLGIGLKVASYSIGGESISFNNSALTTTLSPDAELTQTVYGIQFITLRNLNIIPIINSGEAF